MVFISLIVIKMTLKPKGCVLVTKHTTAVLRIFTAAGEGAEFGKGFFPPLCSTAELKECQLQQSETRI